MESPKDAISEKDKIIREKRIKFYEKSNYQMLKNTKIFFGNNSFNIMLLNNKDNIDEKEIAKALNEFYVKTSKKFDKTLIFRVIEG